MIPVSKIIEDEFAGGVAVNGKPWMVLSAEAAKPQPEGQYIDGRRRAVRLLMDTLKSEGVPPGTQILLSLVCENYIRFAFAAPVAGYAVEYYFAHISQERGTVSIGASQGTPAEEL
jgi:hypothetical protein